MKKIAAVLLSILSLQLVVCSQTSLIKTSSTIPVMEQDSKETGNQLSTLKNEFIAFIHFGPNTRPSPVPAIHLL